MQIDVVQLVIQAGALGLTALLLYGLWKFGGAFVNRLMDNLDQQTENYREALLVQVKVGASLDALCKRLDGYDDRVVAQDEHQVELAELQQEMLGAIRGLAQQQQSHEGRAAARHGQQMAQAQQQMEEANERHAELLKAFKGLNGHS